MRRITKVKTAADLEGYFSTTFGVTFALTIVAAPFVLANSGQGQESGRVFSMLFFGALAIALPTFAKAIIVAGLVFFTCFRLMSLLAPRHLVFVFSAIIAIYLSARISLMTNVDLFPPAISFDLRLSSFASSVGLVAAVCAAFVSSLQMVVVKKYD